MTSSKSWATGREDCGVTPSARRMVGSRCDLVPDNEDEKAALDAIEGMLERRVRKEASDEG